MEARLDSIPRAETLHYLSYHGSFLPEEILSDLARCETLMLRTARPRLVWRLFPLLSDGTLEGTDYRPAGEDIRAFLRTCSSVVLLAATLGSETESLIRRAAAARTADALILDAAGSAAIERVCDNFCADLAAALAPRFLTDRFSPGYAARPLSGPGREPPHRRVSVRKCADDPAKERYRAHRRVGPAAGEARTRLRGLRATGKLLLSKGGQTLWILLRSSFLTAPWAPCSRRPVCPSGSCRSFGTSSGPRS